MVGIDKKRYNNLLNDVLGNKPFPPGFEITAKIMETYFCQLISADVDLYIYRERYFSPLKIEVHLKKLNFRYELFHLSEALVNEQSVIHPHLYQEGLPLSLNSNFKRRFWMKNPIHSFTDLEQVFNLVFDFYINETIPLIQTHREGIEEQRKKHFQAQMDASRVLRNNPDYSAELNKIFEKRTPSVFELVHKEILENSNSQSDHLTQKDEEYVHAFEKTFNLNLPIEYKNLIIGKERPRHLLDLSRTIIEIQHLDFCYFLDLEGKFDEAEEYPRHIKGALRVADYGCGISHLLILNGKEKGNIWIDDRANADKIYPCVDKNNQVVSFRLWALDNGMAV